MRSERKGDRLQNWELENKNWNKGSWEMNVKKTERSEKRM